MTDQAHHACVAGGGRVGVSGGGVPICVHRYADAGKMCSGKRDCSGYCTNHEDKWGSKHPEVGTNLAGFCEATDHLNGCFAVIENGKVVVVDCID